MSTFFLASLQRPVPILKRLVIVASVIMAGACAHRATPEAPVEVALETAMGVIVIALYPDKAPASAGEFLRYVDEGLFEPAGFYRVVRKDNDNGSPLIEIVQGGILERDFSPQTIPHEPTSVTGLRHLDGAVSLARGRVATGSPAAFFICMGDQPSLDAGGRRIADRRGFAVFGQVKSGMDVLRAIHSLDADLETAEDYVKGQLLREPVSFRAYRIE